MRPSLVNLMFLPLLIGVALLSELAYLSIATAIVVTLILLCATIMLNKFIYRPLRVMTERIHSLLAGNFNERFDVKGCHEIQELAKGFNQVANGMEDRMLEIESQGNSLQAINAMLDQNLKEMDTLFHVSRALSLVSEVKSSLASITSTLKMSLGLDKISILLVDSETNEFVLASSEGLSEAVGNTTRIKIADCFFRDALSSGKSLHRTGVAEEPSAHLVPAEGVGNHYVGIPICYSGRAYGIINAIRIDMGFSEMTIEFMTAVAQQIATSLENTRLYEEIQKVSTTDEMTRLRNFRYFKERLTDETKRAQRYGHHLSLIMMDVDYFKKYNDTHGHPAGDDLLRNLASLLRLGCRETDLPARYGGEEFVVLLTATNRDGAAIVAERIRAAVEAHPFRGGEAQPAGKVTISMGVASLLEDMVVDGEDLVKKADTALYEAKKGGRNRVVVASANNSSNETN